MIAQQKREVVQGPLEHPRFGRCLVVTPTLETHRARRFPSQAVVVTAAARRIIEVNKEGDRIQSLVVQGEAHDPTLHPEFHEISQNLRELLDKHFPKAQLCLVSRVPQLDLAQTRHALLFYDRPVVCLAAGTQKMFAALTGEKPGFLKDMVENLGRLGNERLILQADFVRGDLDNSKENEVKAWLRHIADIKPAGVHLLTPAKPQGGSKPITKTRMTQIAEMVTEKTGIPVEVLG